VKSLQRNDRDFNHLDMSGVPDKQLITDPFHNCLSILLFLGPRSPPLGIYALSGGGTGVPFSLGIGHTGLTLIGKEAL